MWPVSYTHLDVYKRQDLVGGIEMDVTDEEAYYISEYLQETADAAGKAAHFLDYGGHMVLDGPQAVSYTHLCRVDRGLQDSSADYKMFSTTSGVDGKE